MSSSLWLAILVCNTMLVDGMPLCGLVVCVYKVLVSYVGARGEVGLRT